MIISAVKNNHSMAFTASAKNTDTASKTGSRADIKPVYDKNPIKKSGERSTAILATVGAGLIAGARAAICNRRRRRRSAVSWRDVRKNLEENP